MTEEEGFRIALEIDQARAEEPYPEEKIRGLVRDIWKKQDAAPGAEKQPECLFHAPTDFLDVKSLSFAIEGFLQNDGATMIGGKSGDYKTFLMLSIAKALFAGEGTTLWGQFRVNDTAEKILYLIPAVLSRSVRSSLAFNGIAELHAERKITGAHAQLGTSSITQGPSTLRSSSRCFCIPGHRDTVYERRRIRGRRRFSRIGE